MGSVLIEKAKQNMSVSEQREHAVIDKDTSNMWRNFWVKVLKNRGYTNVVIAKEFEISESTVRKILRRQ